MGKAKDMAAQGFSAGQIKAAGRWTSNAFMKYIKPTKIVGNPVSETLFPQYEYYV